MWRVPLVLEQKFICIFHLLNEGLAKYRHTCHCEEPLRRRGNLKKRDYHPAFAGQAAHCRVLVMTENRIKGIKNET
jgi:hypothetical protein